MDKLPWIDSLSTFIHHKKSGMHASPRWAGKMSAPPRPTPQKGGFALPRENYQNLWGAAGQSWFQSIEIRKAITRKDPILSDKYLPHSQITWFTQFFAPPREFFPCSTPPRSAPCIPDFYLSGDICYIVAFSLLDGALFFMGWSWGSINCIFLNILHTW